MRTFDEFESETCFLCGSAEDLCGEHKVKRSLIKAHALGDKTEFHSSMNARPLLAQSPKSKVFHFKSRICRTCNSSRTQPADLAFDEFHQRLHRFWSDVKTSALNEAPAHQVVEEVGGVPLDVFRYFAKLLCGLLADVGGPRPILIADFAMGLSDENHIKLKISDLRKRRVNLPLPVANSGGLRCWVDGDELLVRTFEGSLSAGFIDYDYWVRLKAHASRELATGFPAFTERCRRGGLYDSS
ncbi:hypothetical protein PXK00_16455 [Phaeobacter sp. QD34_3]|uniref:hypothetical protein n=1 Tax=unclassified Phaeobacter TaxID=2621772 RepID=UPI00237FC856|nr:MULTISPECIES: hypothetical protein [unclassified Phaeobacter]MDE4134710.1 hypothetical protein [Phaeobacter sp. QD34_3]MDE4138320.1 hypothetical protein [Phaeobacter sp. QD34_24]